MPSEKYFQTALFISDSCSALLPAGAVIACYSLVSVCFGISVSNLLLAFIFIRLYFESVQQKL